LPANEVDLQRQAARLEASVREAGALALSMFKTPLKNWTKGEAQSPVSDADIAVDNLLRERLTDDSIAWLSEESVDDPVRLGARYVWIVDPIDGTRAYIAGLPDWSVSAALIENGRPVVACLFAPVSEEFYAAVAGAGATRNGATIAVSQGTDLAQARVAGPRKLLDRLQAVSPPTAPSRPRSPAAIATIGTLRPLTFWCTKRAAR
jgi:myo-inositol-1(or 4)-monophosphatase